jgi:hypothetical protein
MLRLRGHMQHWMIDNFGELHRSTSDSLYKSMGNVERGTAAESYAIENIGFIAITERKPSIHIRFRPEIVSEQAIASLYYWLFDFADKKIAVSWLENVWNTEHVKSTPDAVTLISSTMENLSRLGRLTGPRIISIPSNAVRARWREHAAHIEPFLDVGDITDGLQQDLNLTFRGRWSIYNISLPVKSVTAIARGPGYPPLHPMLKGELKDFSYQKIPDRDYVQWVDATYIKIARNGDAVFEDVDAVVEWPRFGEMRTRYWRILIPFNRSAASANLLAISGTDSSIDLRPKDIQEMRQVNGRF